MNRLTATELDDLSLARRLSSDGVARDLREKAQLPQSEIARTLGVGRALVCNWEHGRRVPTGLVGARYGALLRQWQRGSL
ncbi:MAG TPA: hypothetical protein VIK06_06595 [Candidatus Limnocylindrales bacterium]